MPGLVFTCYITGVEFSAEQRMEMIRYLRNKSHPNGGWGLHIAGEPTVFGTALNYATMRLLGVPAADPQLRLAHKFLMSQGGAVGCPHWGKFWLSVLNGKQFFLTNLV
jgi:lanosterol synthase